MTITVEPEHHPTSSSLLAQLAWIYYSNNKWLFVRTEEEQYILIDSSHELETALIFPDKDELIDYLEGNALKEIESDPVDFFKHVISVPEIIDENVAETMKRTLLYMSSQS